MTCMVKLGNYFKSVEFWLLLSGLLPSWLLRGLGRRHLAISDHF